MNRAGFLRLFVIALIGATLAGCEPGMESTPSSDSQETTPVITSTPGKKAPATTEEATSSPSPAPSTTPVAQRRTITVTSVDDSGTTEEATRSPSPTPSTTPVPQGKRITVTSVDDSGAGTLRQALLDAEVGDIVIFTSTVFPPANPVSLVLRSGLPPIRQGYLTIDASDAGVILDGSQVGGEWTPGIELDSNYNTVFGLQVVHFTGPGVLINPGARFNTVGGDRSIGSGLLGQGNLFGDTSDGIAIMGSDNRIAGNLIGTDITGTGNMGNRGTGVLLWGDASRNIIGPENIIACNGSDGGGGGGVELRGVDVQGNVITENSIHDNASAGIFHNVDDGIVSALPVAPIILEFDIAAGLAEGVACPLCSVEIFSTSSKDGEIFEGQVVADHSGNFTLSKGTGFSGPWLTATSRSADENTSAFSAPTVASGEPLQIQSNSTNPRNYKVR